jgi:hypothetical protein
VTIGDPIWNRCMRRSSRWCCASRAASPGCSRAASRTYLLYSFVTLIVLLALVL